MTTKVSGAGMKRPVVFMLPGQGSQYYQMGRELYERLPRFRYWMELLDKKVQERAGFSVVGELFGAAHGKSKIFSDLARSHPAIVLVEYSLAKVLVEAGIEPDYYIGASLGEFTAAALSGGISIDTLIDLVLHQGTELTNDRNDLGMTSVFMDEERLLPIVEKYGCEIAGEQSASHFVIAGNKNNLNACHELFRNNDISYQQLAVNQAFHCSLLDNEKDKLLPFIRSKSYSPLNKPLFSCALKQKISSLSTDHFWKVIREPIFFRTIVDICEQEGPCIYIDIGPSSTLTNFAKMNVRRESQSVFYPVMDPFGSDIERLEKLLSRFGASFGSLTNNTQKVNSMKAYIFPGQGSQFVGMGKELFSEFPEHVAQANDILGYSIESLCISDEKKSLNLTQYTQPALYVVEALSYLKCVQDKGEPQVVAGHSLGEYAALFAAGVFDFSTGLMLVKRRGELMAAADIDGGMAAVLNIDTGKIDSILKKGNLTGIDVANFNKPTQTVISGPKKELAIAARLFERAGAAFVPLNVSAPFHSRYMQPIVSEFSDYLRNFEFTPPRLPVISNVTARPHEFSGIKRLLAQQISHSVRWTETIRYLMAQGNFDYTELGPGDVLTKLVGSIVKECSPVDDEKSLFEPAGMADVRNEVPPAIPSTPPSVHDKVIRIMKVIGNDNGLSDLYRTISNYVIRPLNYSGNKALISTLADYGVLTFAGISYDDVLKDGSLLNDLAALNKTYHNIGAGIHANIIYPEREMQLVDALLSLNLQHYYARSYSQATVAITKLRIKTALSGDRRGTLMVEVGSIAEAEKFLRPPSHENIRRLIASGDITEVEAKDASSLVMADAVVYNGDWRDLHAVIELRNKLLKAGVSSDINRIFIGSTGIIGSPASIARAMNCGADFVCAGDIFMCSPESGMDMATKIFLQTADTENFTQAPDADLFEFGHKIPVLNNGAAYISASNRLYAIWKNENSLNVMSDPVRAQLQEKFFPEGLMNAWSNMVTHKSYLAADEIRSANSNPRLLMTLLMKDYLRNLQDNPSTRAVEVDREIADHNKWLNRNGVISWENRPVHRILDSLHAEAATMIIQNMKLAS